LSNIQETVTGISSNSLKRSGFKLEINNPVPKGIFNTSDPIIVDVETDENDNWVGMALCNITANTVYYYSDFELARSFEMSDSKLIAHNAKFDIRILKKWGFSVGSKNIFLDTMIMSYVYDTTAETHRLKEIAHKYLNFKWSTYEEMISKETNAFKEQKEEYIRYFKAKAQNPKWKGTPKQIKEYIQDVEKVNVSSLDDVKELAKTVPIARKLMFLRSKRCTLNFHPVEDVANYCGWDVYATKCLATWFLQKMTPDQRRILWTLEMPLYRILFDMKNVGIYIDQDNLSILIHQYEDKLAEFRGELQHITNDGDMNFSSDKQVASYLIKRGFKLPRTVKGNYSVKASVLEMFKNDEFCKTLLDYRKAEKMYDTFLLGLKNQPTFPKIHTTFNQVVYDEDKEKFGGISTNRLSSSNPNLQNIPRRGGASEIIRPLFIPDPGHTMIVGDYSQIEYRLLAHFSQEPVLLEAYRNGEDMHAKVGGLMAPDKPKEEARDLGKSLNFAIVYGAGSEKVASMAKCTQEEAETFLQKYWEVLPKVVYWKNQTIEHAKTRGAIRTFLGRPIPLPGLSSRDLRLRSHAERCSVNYIIQGSAAEIIKLAMIKCVDAGFLPRVQVHDELIFSVMNHNDGYIAEVVAGLKKIMESVVTLDVPLVVDIHEGKNWNDAKG